MKKSSISFVFTLLVLVLFLSCTITPGLKKYSSESAAEKSVIKNPLLVNTEWLASKRSSLKLRIIDYGMKVQNYQKGHIVGAVFIDRKTAWNKVNDNPGMLPSAETIIPLVVATVLPSTKQTFGVIVPSPQNNWRPQVVMPYL